MDTSNLPWRNDHPITTSMVRAGEVLASPYKSASRTYVFMTRWQTQKAIAAPRDAPMAVTMTPFTRPYKYPAPTFNIT